MENECPYDVDALYWIFGGDVSVGDGGDHCDAEVNDVGVHFIPRQECHLVESPAVINPGDVGGVGSVIVVIVDPKADFVEEDAHEVGIEVCVDH